MKKFTFLVFLTTATLISTSAFIFKSSTGIVGQTGSPGETTCTACHGGGSSDSTSVTITAVPAFNNGQYKADSLYQITVTVAAKGFSRFGFGCEILDSLNANAGTMQSPASGVQLLNAGPRRNATHTTPKLGNNAANFSFQWKAPTSGRVNFYICGNAVNFNGNTTGDLPIPTSMFIYPAPGEPQDTTSTNSISKYTNSLSEISIYPNPVSDFCTLNYSLNKQALVTIEIMNIQGGLVKTLLVEKQNAGSHNQIVDLRTLSSGVYFLKGSIEGEKVSQKLITVY